MPDVSGSGWRQEETCRSLAIAFIRRCVARPAVGKCISTCTPCCRSEQPPAAHAHAAAYCVLGCAGSGPKGEVKCCAFIDFSVRPHPSAMAADDARHGGEADARAFELLIAMQTLKGLEQLV